MADFEELPLQAGVGVVHVNRFRVVVRAPADSGAYQRIAASLFNNFPTYLDNISTASVTHSPKLFNGEQTLKFRGVARIRPFRVLPPALPVPIPVPRSLRDWMMPDLHTDYVGLAQRNGQNGFTVQTLRRGFVEDDDVKIVAPIAVLCAVGGVAGAALAAVLVPLALSINRMHFLAGRRAWRFDTARAFGYDNDDWVMETAAIERFSNWAVVGSQLAVGDFQTLVKDIWVTFLRQFLTAHGLEAVDRTRGAEWTMADPGILCLQDTVDDISRLDAHAHVIAMRQLHAALP